MEYLKIKDDVDLKKLEKFGFEYYKQYIGAGKYNTGYMARPYDAYIKIPENNKFNRKIILSTDDYSCTQSVLAKLYDLFKAGLVEKVVEE